MGGEALMHRLKVGRTTFHFNPDLSGTVIVDPNHEDGAQVNVPFDDLSQFVARARAAQNRGLINRPKNPEKVLKRAATLEKVKEQVVELLREEQKKLLGDETELTKKMFQVAINAVNGAR